MMKTNAVIMAGLAALLISCGPDAEPETSPDFRALDAAQDVDVVAQAATGSDVGSLLNARRAENGLPALTPSAQLAAAAQVHAQDMVSNRFFSHTGSDNSSVGQRVRAQGYGYCFVAENIAQGQPTPDAVMQSWMNSSGHRANNLSRLAVEYGSARGAGNTWVLVFGKPGC